MKLNTVQQLRIDIISKYLCGEIYYKDAIVVLKVKERQFRRLVKAFKEDGIASVIHGNKGSHPKNKTSNKIRRQIIQLYKGRFRDLNIIHFKEKLIELEIYPLPSYSTIRNILMEEKLLTVQIKRNKKSFAMRKRYEKEGIMVQIDGSHHRWLAGKGPCCLTLAMDDATGKILAAKFTPTETTIAAMDVVESIIKKHGSFQMLYSDKAGIYGGGKRDGYSNMNRALSELDILSIQANTPQAKGRVERAFRTLQSRLIVELRLREIETLEEANSYLENEYIEIFNKKFSVIPGCKYPAYKKVDESIDLNEVFCLKNNRVIQSGEIVSYEGYKYLIKTKTLCSMQKQMVEVRSYRNGALKIFFQGEELEFELFEIGKKAA